MTLSVACFVLNWNSKPYLDDCIGALLASDYQKFKVILIDNASVDGSVEYVTRQYPSVEIISNWANLGFAAGNNVGLAALEDDVAILVNPDVIVSQQLIGSIAAIFEDDNRIGVVGCLTYYPGTRKIQHAGGTIAYPRGEPDHYWRGHEDEGQLNQLEDVEYVTGAVFAVKKQLLDEIGLFDGGYYMYFEEADFCKRAAKAGYRIVLSRDASAEHVESAQASRESKFYHDQLQKSRWRFLLKHYAIQDLLADTFPAEREWLRQVEPIVLAAASRAYRHSLMDLPEIIERRQTETQDALTAEQITEINYELGELRRLTLEMYWGSPVNKELLSTAAGLETKAFYSNQPVIGPVIARFRELWSRVAVKPFADPLLDQQRALNRANSELLLNAVKDGDDEIGHRVQQDYDLAAIVESLREANKTLAQLEKRLRALEERPKESERDVRLLDG